MRPFINKILVFFRLNTELEDTEEIHQSIVESIEFKGTNLWILVFATVVASVGLNVNSTAVIIGAMLISPLMGPINGIGYSVATYDLTLFKKSLNNYSFAVLLSVITSFLYFSVSPVSAAYSELLARTSPTIFDVIIALFGGFAGIVATCSRKKGNVLPGVAIATALMPPLCTVGYGLATRQMDFFAGALYLFIINSVFIALSAMIVSYLLKMPARGIVSTLKKRNARYVIYTVISLTIIPSVYYGYKLVKQEQFTYNAQKFIKSVSYVDNRFLLKHFIDEKNYAIELIYGGTQVQKSVKQMIHKEAIAADLDPKKIKIRQGLQFKDYDKELGNLSGIKIEINDLAQIIDRQNIQLDSLKYGNISLGQYLIDTLNSRYNSIESIAISERVKVNKLAVLKIKTLELELSKKMGKNELDSLYQIVKFRLPEDSIEIKYKRVYQ